MWITTIPPVDSRRSDFEHKMWFPWTQSNVTVPMVLRRTSYVTDALDPPRLTNASISASPTGEPIWRVLGRNNNTKDEAGRTDAMYDGTIKYRASDDWRSN